MSHPDHMQTRRAPRLRGTRHGFTVLELLVAVSLMTVIIFILYSIFSQTQKALHSNIAQVDIHETGRAAMDLISRELEGMKAQPPAGQPRASIIESFGPLLNEPNDLRGFRGVGNGERTHTNLAAINFWFAPAAIPTIQPLLATAQRTNHLHDFFFMTQGGDGAWSGIGYQLRVTNGVGSLFRFERQTRATNGLVFTNLAMGFQQARQFQTSTNGFQFVADGIIHLSLIPYTSTGLPMTPEALTRAFVDWDYSGSVTNISPANEPGAQGTELQVHLNQPFRMIENLVVQRTLSGVLAGRVMGDALPAAIDVELGVLDPKTLEKYKGMAANAELASKFLSQQAANVHLFRNRIQVRAAGGIPR